MADAISRAFFELQFRVAFIENSADEFQALFSSVMEKRYPTDFIRVRPWGKAGDRKNDGYLRSKRTLFQVYAPNEIKAAECVAKIRKDFEGALPHWKKYFDVWVFVHNSRNGLGPQVVEALLSLDSNNANISVISWGFEELRQEAMALSDSDLASYFGPPPSRNGMIELGLAELAPVLDQISRLAPTAEPDLRPVPADKLKLNMLSPAAGDLLRAGMSRADLVRKYFSFNPPLQDQIAEAFRVRYRALRTGGSSPDDTFAMLQRFAGGDLVPSPSLQNAVLACLAFFFEECDIFERPVIDGGEHS